MSVSIILGKLTIYNAIPCVMVRIDILPCYIVIMMILYHHVCIHFGIWRLYHLLANSRHFKTVDAYYLNVIMPSIAWEYFHMVLFLFYFPVTRDVRKWWSSVILLRWIFISFNCILFWCRARASELIKALNGQDCPHPIACCLFANKVATFYLLLQFSFSLNE